MLTEVEKSMYARQMILPELGSSGQEKLKHAHVLVIGAGGLGCPALMYLAVAGVGHIGIMDFDTVEETNLHRQTLYTWDHLGLHKATTAATELRKHNPFIVCTPIVEKFTVHNALQIIANYDVVVDGTDTFTTKYLINDACLILNKPLVYGAVSQFEGQISVFGLPQKNRLTIPSLHHYIPFSKDLNSLTNCAVAGVLGVLPGIVGSLQAAEVIKIITGIGEILAGKILIIDVLNLRFQQFVLQDFQIPSPLKTLVDYDKIRVEQSDENYEISTKSVKQWMDDGTPFQFIDVREDWERNLCSLESMHIPLNDLPERIQEINIRIPIVFYCHNGIRSRNALAIAQQLLQMNGYSMTGGIEDWSLKIDPAITRY